MATSLTDLVFLRDGLSVPRFVLELVLACDWGGIRLTVVDGEVVASANRPEMIDDELLKDLRAWRWPIAAILQHTPDDRATAGNPGVGTS